ncbi:MAG: hypothetical protein ACXAEX_04985 [Promethearchaeota archaeon]|jgi:hypothetical protein
MEKDSRNTEIRSFLIRKLLIICPVCNKRIYGEDIDILNIDRSKVSHWPLRYIHCHTNNNVPFHALTIFLDANFSVRGNEVSNFVKVENV